MAADYKELIERQRIFFASGKSKSIEFRKNSLKRLKQVIKKRNAEIVEALNKDFGKSEFETFASEVMGCLDEIDFALKKLHVWAAPKKVKTPVTLFRASSRIYFEPYGITLVISAWNYPFQLALNPLIGVIAAGNCCIVKPSELSPNTSRLVSEIIDECFEKEYCTVVEGGAEETTALLKEKFDFIHYTGSARVGTIISQAAAKHLTPVVLELGGKSPCIVDETADLETSARRIVWGKFLNAGQTCVAPDYLVVHRKIKDAFFKAVKEKIKEFYGESPIQSGDYCRIVNQKHFDRLFELLNEGTIVHGGNVDKEELFIEPTVIDDVTWDLDIMQEEIFGPILPVMVYDDLSELIETINSHEKPLSLYLFSCNRKVKKRILREVSFGGGCINATVVHTANPHLPFGGVGSSGMGNYHGKWSFETFSHKKSVLDKALWIDIRLQYPPYKNKVKVLKKLYK